MVMYMYMSSNLCPVLSRRTYLPHFYFIDTIDQDVRKEIIARQVTRTLTFCIQFGLNAETTLLTFAEIPSLFDRVIPLFVNQLLES